MSFQQPVAIEAEKSLLGGLIVYPNAIKLIDELALWPEHFYVPQHQILYQAMLDCYRITQSLDFVALETFLRDRDILAKLGGIGFLASLAADATSTGNMTFYAKLILDKFQLRQLIETSGEIRDVATSGENIDYILDEVENKILDITRNRRSNDFQKAGKVALEVEQDVRILSKQERKQTGMVTGYTKLDEMTRGFQNSDLIILAARPSVGKTAFALNIALETARRNNKSIAVFSLEMPAKQLISRILASMSLVPMKKIQTGHALVQNDWNALSEAVTVLNHTQIYIDDSSATKMSDIFSKCRKLKNDTDLGMVVIDYIQLINSTGRFESRQQEVSLISRQLKQLARELDVPVIALSQLSRGVESRSDKRPMLSDLRESGAIEQDADIVMMLYREEYNKTDRTNRLEVEPIEVILAKHRNGETGTVQLSFRGAINKYFNVVATESDNQVSKV